MSQTLASKLADEDLFPLVEAVKKASKISKHKTTCDRWATVGIHGIRLESTRLGSVKVTSVEAVLRFMDALAAIDNQVSEQPEQVPPRQQELASVRSAKKLAERIATR